MYPLSINSRYFSTLRASASVAVVPGLHKEPWFRRLGARASTTVTSHTSCLPISQGIMVTSSGRLPSVRYSPRGSSIEGKSRDPNVCFMRELRVAWRARKTVQTVPFNSYHSGTYAQRRCWHQDANQLKFEVADHQVSGPGLSSTWHRDTWTWNCSKYLNLILDQVLGYYWVTRNGSK